MLQKYTRVKDPDILEDAYGQFHDYLESIPYVSRKGIESIIGELADKEPSIKQMKVDDFIDMRFVNELEKEGFFKNCGGNRQPKLSPCFSSPVEQNSPTSNPSDAAYRFARI